MKCLAKDRNHNECRNHALGDTQFCTYHAYMVSYTEEMLAKCVCCSGCNKMLYLGEKRKVCENCCKRSQKKQKEARENVILCKSTACKFQKSEENEYCLKHQLCFLVDEVTLRNKRLCSNYLRGCREELDLEHPKNRCETCLEKDREKDRLRRGGVQNTVATDTVAITEKPCTTCCKVLPMAMFEGVKGITKTCRTCRDDNKKQDANRDKEHRNSLARVAEAKPERIAIKQEWKENNYEKVAETWQKSRNTRLEEVGDEEYFKRNADDAKRWRENNPDKVLVSNEARKSNINIHYSNYVRTADYKNNCFELTKETFDNIVQSPCYYCGIIEEKGFNGIDRKNQCDGYVIDNCVSCCQMCNYIKNTICTSDFLKRVEHIVCYQENTTILHPELFSNHQMVKYMSYWNSAKTRNLLFQLFPDQFEEITSYPCYICGKTNTEMHKNGIDRFDNTQGYVFSNCRSCCGDSNYMKSNYIFEEWIDKLTQIYHQHGSKVTHVIEENQEQEHEPVTEANHDQNRMIRTSQKKTKKNQE